jgi:uncharacterized protein with PQ loop repeat
MQSIYLVAGFLGTFIISVVLVPQIYRTFKTRDVEGISFTWLVMHTLGCSLWILYGIENLNLESRTKSKLEGLPAKIGSKYISVQKQNQCIPF